MLKRCILAENRKLHASPIWAMFFLLPVLSATYGTFNYLQNLEILTDGWYSLWTQHTLFYSMLFFPAMVATYAAYLWRLEHLGHNWNLIMASPVRPMDLFAAKFAVATKLALLTHGFVFALFVFCGKVFAHLPGCRRSPYLCFYCEDCWARWLSLPHSWCWPWSSAALPCPSFWGFWAASLAFLPGPKAFPCSGPMP